ncbi:MAG: hypothetical protein SPG64_00425 [Candidatus Enteromonas sp.]|nr:hypothetical protein [Candidatus Enteromonas sp.]
MAVPPSSESSSAPAVRLVPTFDSFGEGLALSAAIAHYYDFGMGRV